MELEIIDYNDNSDDRIIVGILLYTDTKCLDTYSICNQNKEILVCDVTRVNCTPKKYTINDLSN